MDFVIANSAVTGTQSFSTSSPANLPQSRLIAQSPTFFTTFQQNSLPTSLNNANNQTTLFCNLHLRNQFSSSLPSTSFSINNLLSLNEKLVNKKLIDNVKNENSNLMYLNKTEQNKFLTMTNNNSNEKRKRKNIEQYLKERLSSKNLKSDQNFNIDKIEKIDTNTSSNEQSLINNITSYINDKDEQLLLPRNKDLTISNLTKFINEISTTNSLQPTKSISTISIDNLPKQVSNSFFPMPDIKLMCQNDDQSLQKKQKQLNELLVNNNSFPETNLISNNLLEPATPLPIDQYILMSRHSS